MDGKTTDLKRRSFLLTLGLGGAAAAVVGGRAVIEPQAVAGDKREKETGYRLTEHVKRYYRTAKV